MGVSKKVISELIKVPEERIICKNCWSCETLLLSNLVSTKYCVFWKTTVDDEEKDYCSFFEDKEKE